MRASRGCSLTCQLGLPTGDIILLQKERTPGVTPIDLRSPRSAIVVMVAFLVGACVPVVPTTMAPPTRSPTIDVPPSATSLPPVSTLTRPQREARVKDLLETNGR